MNALYLLVVDKAWAKLYRTASAAQPLALVYHQALFGGMRAGDVIAQDELARSLCRLLRADRLTGKYARLVMLANPAMLAALHRQYDGDWHGVVTGSIDELPARYTDEDLGAWLQRHVANATQPGADGAAAQETEQASASSLPAKQRS